MKGQRIPDVEEAATSYGERLREINQFERYLVDNDIAILKFFLNLSKEEQKRRFLVRLESPDKNWKFSAADVEERAFWDDYQRGLRGHACATPARSTPRGT